MCGVSAMRGENDFPSRPQPPVRLGEGQSCAMPNAARRVGRFGALLSHRVRLSSWSGHVRRTGAACERRRIHARGSSSRRRHPTASPSHDMRFIDQRPTHAATASREGRMAVPSRQGGTRSAACIHAPRRSGANRPDTSIPSRRALAFPFRGAPPDVGPAGPPGPMTAKRKPRFSLSARSLRQRRGGRLARRMSVEMSRGCESRRRRRHSNGLSPAVAPEGSMRLSS